MPTSTSDPKEFARSQTQALRELGFYPEQLQRIFQVTGATHCVKAAMWARNCFAALWTIYAGATEERLMAAIPDRLDENLRSRIQTRPKLPRRLLDQEVYAALRVIILTLEKRCTSSGDESVVLDLFGLPQLPEEIQSNAVVRKFLFGAYEALDPALPDPMLPTLG